MTAPKYRFSDRVRIIPLDGVAGRVINQHNYSGGWEYDVRYYHEGKECVTKLFEDEMEEVK